MLTNGTTPLRKPGKPSCYVTSYRPVSLLSSPSKILERIILKRINHHIENNHILPPFQFGFRQQHSTTHQLLRVVKQIRSGFSRTQSTGMILLDLKSAFDSVWQDAIIFKMHNLNFPIYLTKFVQSFLKNRTFKVRINSSFSDAKTIPAGVPQGAVLSPVLFNIFMADIPVNHNCTSAQFADDVSILFTCKRTASVKKELQQAVKSFAKYVKLWKLKLNPQKSEAIFFTRRRTRKAFPNRKLQVENQDIEWKSSAKYLGFTLDQKLTFKEHNLKIW